MKLGLESPVKLGLESPVKLGLESPVKLGLESPRFFFTILFLDFFLGGIKKLGWISPVYVFFLGEFVSPKK